MSQTLKCKELNCDETINYEPDHVIAFIKRPRPIPGRAKKKSKTVYLRCSKGHIHKYIVSIED